MSELKILAVRFWYVVATLIIVAALLVSVSRLLTPVLNEHLPDFEAWSSDLLQVPVKIKHVKISWAVYEPQIDFSEVTILAKGVNKPTFAIRQLVVNLNIWRSLFAWKPVTQSVKVSGLHLTLRQHSTGGLLIDELKDLAVVDSLTGAQGSVNDLLIWLFAQSSLTLDDVSVDYFLPSGTHKSILIENLVLQNNTIEHRLTGSALLNQEIPVIAKMNLMWTGTILDIHHIPGNLSAHLYLYLEGVSLDQWLSRFSWRNLQVTQGLGSAKIWGTWDNSELQRLQTQFQLYDVQLQSSTTNQTQEIPRISGHVGWKREGEKQVFAGNDLLIDLPEHLWPTTDFVVTAVPDKTGNYILQHIKFGYLDLSDTKDILVASGLLPKTLEDNIIALNPKGITRNIDIMLPPLGFDNDTIHTKLDMQFSELSIDPWKKFPGIKNATGIFGWTGTAGNLKLDCHQAVVTYKDFFATPLLFDQLVANMQWQNMPDGSWSLNVNNLQVLNQDIDIRGATQLTIPVKDSPKINASASFSVLNMSHISNYLPLSALDPELVVWLKNAFINGSIKNGKAVLQGRLADFPFENKNGTFVINGILNNVDLNYAKNWPVLQRIMGELTFAGSAMSVDVSSGQLLGSQALNVHAVIPYIGAREPQILTVQANIKTDMAQGLAFIRQSPLNDTLGKDLSNLELEGPMQLKLGLTIPLKTPTKTTVEGDATVTNSILSLPLWNISIEQLKGFFYFTENDFEARNLRGIGLGKPVTLNFTTVQAKNKPAYVQADVQGVLAVDELEKVIKIPLEQYVQGFAIYQGQLRTSHDQPTQVTLTSNLKGMEVKLPDPFGKKAQDISNLKVDISITAAKDLLANLHYGKLTAAAIAFQKTKFGMEFDRGEIQLGGGEATLPTEPGLVISALFKFVDWKILQPYLDWAKQNKPEVNPGEPKKGLASIFRAVNLKANVAQFFGLRMNNAKIQMAKGDNNWTVNVNSDQIQGQGVLPENYSRAQGHFQRFYVVLATNEGPAEFFDPKTIPALSLTANDMRFGKIYLKDVELQTTPTSNGLIINALKVNSDIVNLQSSGSWLAIDKKYKTNLRGTLSTTNISQMLSRWGVSASALIGTKADAQFDLNWPDAPYKLCVKNLSGALGLKFGPGQIVNLGDSTDAKLGLGRFLNLLSLSSLPRRLSLNFTDLFQKGYSFDSMKADFRLQNGDAFTNNFTFDGTLAKVALSGRIGLRERDYDLLLSVTPYVTDSIPIAATIATLNPLVGVAAWAVEKVVGPAMSQATGSTYRVTGPWDAPKLQQVVGKPVRSVNGKPIP